MINGVKGDLGITRYGFDSIYEIKNEELKVNNSAISTLGEDTFERSESFEKLTYSKSEVEKKAKSVNESDELSRLIEENERKQEEFKKLIQSLITNQGESYNVVLFGQKLNVSPEIAQQAKESISDGGEYSVDSVATNIINMAKALSGGDSSKISELKEGFLKGFKEAEKVWGDELPDICKKTYDEVLSRFDEWENQA
ncbi:hypothetical protein [uncultured Clostridium sp.]|uniref:hypothetical protein n=1 Tax=uncultured Clostridium sp. TaxID=59620 RepID=UPI0025E10D7B|nr:hypothetical protein [uncultured Clostridium sp.]